MGCSLYRSEGRKNLEDQGRTLSGKDFFMEWQCQPHQLQGILDNHYWIEDNHWHWLTPSEHCIHARPLTGSNADN